MIIHGDRTSLFETRDTELQRFDRSAADPRSSPSQEVGLERDAGGRLGAAAAARVSAASFSVQALLVSFDRGFQP